ncbi:transposable element Tcb2 transposase [Trichonephila clavipes]|nr:transposable element Tcb2 transposase [Trichonephila clavipes]
MNATLLHQQLCSATGTTVSTQTVRNRLHGVCLYDRRPMVCVRLTSRHRRDSRECATEQVNRRRNELSNVHFSDEPRFSVHPDNRRIFIWRDHGCRSNPAFVYESVRFGVGGVLVYVGISIDGRADLYIIRDGPLTAHIYRDEILRPIVSPYAAAIGDDFILMDDNCRPHRANLEDELLAANHPPQTLQELERSLLEEWDRRPQLVINSLIDSMPQSCQVIYSQFGLAIHQTIIKRRFVEWAQNEIDVVPDFHKRILFCDEAHFWLNGYVNKQNCGIWSEANPQGYVETPLHPEKLTVWCALWAGGITGPYFFKKDEGHNVTELWFQQDGATCHTARATIDLLKDTFGDRLISRLGPVNWPPRSCDLTPLDYFLWSYVKSLVYADKLQTLDHLEDNIHRVIADIRP